VEFEFAPLYSLGFGHPEDPFDLTRLPFQITDGLTIEDIPTRLPQNAFERWHNMLGESRSEMVKNVKYALVHRFHLGENAEQQLTTYAMSCLRLIRPMRQRGLVSVQGKVKEDGSFDVTGFSLAESESGVEVVEAHKLSTLRTIDAEELHRLLPEFNRALKGDYWKFRMAAQFHDLGYFQSNNWKPRFMLWTSALESLFTSHNRDHKGSRVAIARIKWFWARTREYTKTANGLT
jgi:hypothetical protein